MERGRPNHNRNQRNGKCCAVVDRYRRQRIMLEIELHSKFNIKLVKEVYLRLYRLYDMYMKTSVEFKFSRHLVGIARETNSQSEYILKRQCCVSILAGF